MNKQNALHYLRIQIEQELKLIKNIHNNSKGTSFIFDAKNKAKEDQQYLKVIEDIKVLSISGVINVTIANELKKTVDSAREFIEV